MKTVLLCGLVGCLSFAAGWWVCEWAEQEVQSVLSHMTVIPQPVPQVP
jgi:hypothetical protein